MLLRKTGILLHLKFFEHAFRNLSLLLFIELIVAQLSENLPIVERLKLYSDLALPIAPVNR